MALPKEPRQKMINLMYLVLTALLALNVSAEILNAFRTVNSSLQKTNVLVTASTATYMSSLKDLLSKPESAEKAKQWYPLAAKAQQIANNSYEQVKILKDSIMLLSGFDPAKNHDSTYKEDDINTPQRVLVDGGAGKRLLATLNQFKTDMLGIDPSITKEFAETFPLDLTPPKSHNNASDSWEGAYFHMTPTIAAVTILSKFQNDIRTAENKVVEYCHKQVGQVALRVNAYAPIVALSSTYLMNGQELNVSAGVAAFNSENQPVISIDGQSEATGADGMVEKKEVANGVGGHSVHVHMSYKDQDGKSQTFDKDYPYTVGQPTGISVSADDVNVLYVGLENHLTINSGSVGSEKVTAVVDNGSVHRGDKPGQWIATPVKPGNVNLNVNVDGKPTTYTFRVRSVPDPVAKVGNSKGGRISANDFKSQSGVRAELENFVFEGLKFSINSYTIIVTGGKKGFQVKQVAGNSFNPITDIIEGLGPNTNVTIDEIRATGPGGQGVDSNYI